MDMRQIMRILNMLGLRRLIGKGINMGIDRAAGRGKPPAEMTPEERAQAKTGKDMAKRARKLGRMGRRIGRF